MQKKKAIAVLVIIGSISTVFLGYMLRIPQEDSNGQDQITTIEPHHYNELNWWDVAWELGENKQFLTPFSEILRQGNRYVTYDRGYAQAAEYILDRMDSLGLDASYCGNHDSVLVHQPGYGNDSRAIVFGAHLDTGPGGLGVDNNAGGCAVVSMIASILSQYRLPVDIYYCYFSYNMYFLDEQKKNRAMYGSKEIVDHLQSEGVDVIAYYNFDQLLFRDELQDEGQRLLVEHERLSLHSYHSTKYLADILVSFMKKSGEDIISTTEEYLTDTDHQSFWDAGYPAVNVRSGHRPDPENPPSDSKNSPDYNTTQAILLAKAAATTAVYLSQQGNGNTTDVKIESSLAANHEMSYYTAMTINQRMNISAILSNQGTLDLQIRNASDVILPSTSISGNFTLLQTDYATGLGQVCVTILNNENTTMSFEIHLRYESDTDGNGVPDAEQYTWPPPDPPLDWDKDGLPNKDENEEGTDIFVADTDGDSMNDGPEIENGLDPLVEDSLKDLDDDGLTNIREMRMGLAPNNNDTDSDRIPDGWEVLFRTDPLVNDSTVDADNDNLTNYEEYQNGSDPLKIDGDSDGLTDWEEVQLGTDPLNDDSDEDGLEDELEILEGLDPLVPDYDSDLSPDGLDPNPRVNALLVIIMLSCVPILIGSIIFWRRIG
ncbi:MAG: M28 family peptidase [Candidatus Thorarchaeota archaeon]|nr:M28 family peptidase [Candidatus Thorarchaeota archaeon]